MRGKVRLACEKCGDRNYRVAKSPARESERLERRKYCPRCNEHTTHRETR